MFRFPLSLYKPIKPLKILISVLLIFALLNCSPALGSDRPYNGIRYKLYTGNNSMRFKSGVQLNGIQREIVIAMAVVNEIIPDVTVTSVMDGKHSRTSLHYVGYAFDVRTRDLHPSAIRAYANEIRERLTDEYDVVIEYNHIHIEFQPKRF